MILDQQFGKGFYELNDYAFGGSWSWVSGDSQSSGTVASLGGRVGLVSYLDGLVGLKPYLAGSVGLRPYNEGLGGSRG